MLLEIYTDTPPSTPFIHVEFSIYDVFFPHLQMCSSQGQGRDSVKGQEPDVDHDSYVHGL